MKWHYLLFSALSIVAFANSCTHMDDVKNPVDVDETITNTKGIDPSSLSISRSDAYAYSQYRRDRMRKLCEGGTAMQPQIQYYPDGDSCLYIINFQDSWEIISGDKRTDVVLAAGNGHFNPEEANEDVLGWLADIVGQINAIRNSGEDTKSAGFNVSRWESFIQSGWEIDKKYSNTPELWQIDFSVCYDTRASAVDTTYHPSSGHYESSPLTYDISTETVVNLNSPAVVHKGQGDFTLSTYTCITSKYKIQAPCICKVYEFIPDNPNDTWYGIYGIQYDLIYTYKTYAPVDVIYYEMNWDLKNEKIAWFIDFGRWFSGKSEWLDIL